MSTKSFVDLMSDPSFIEQQRATREREASEQHERQVARGRPSAYREASAGVKPTPQQLREMVTGGRDGERRAFNFESQVRAQSRRPGHFARQQEQARDRR